MDETAPPQQKAPSNFWKELFKLLLLALVVVVPFRLYVAQPFIVDGASMDPTFHTGEYLIVDELSYHFKTPERGSVLIFRYPKDPKKYFIKRVIGLPGEMLSINEGVVTITSNEYPEGLVLDEPYVKLKKADSLNFTLAQGEYFVMGDNRLGSADSRIWGPVPEDNIIGRPILRFYPPSLWPGDSDKYLRASNEQNE
jgi:signal peptidase I